MKRKSGEKGSTAVAFTFALFLVVFTAITVYLFLAKTWWFPPAITAFGAEYDSQFHRTLIITGVVFVLAQLGLALVDLPLPRPRAEGHLFRGQLHHGVRLDAGDGRDVRRTGPLRRACLGRGAFQGAAPGALQMEVTGQQFAWNFRYAGPDGKWGRPSPNW